MRPIRPLLSLTLLATLSLSFAQTSAPKTGLAALPTPDGALLRWYLPGDLVPSGGFLVQLSGGSSLAVPVASPQPFSAALGISRAEYDAVNAIYTAPLNDDNRIQRAIFNLNVVARPGYAKALGIQTTLRDLKPGAYTATVYAVNGGNRTKVGSAEFTTGATPAVPTPTALKATGGKSGAQLTWTPPNTPGNLVVAYNVYRAGTTGGFIRLDPAPFFRTTAAGGDVFKDTALKPGQTGRYQVTSVDLFGRESSPTAAVQVTAGAGPVSPEITRAVPGNRIVTLEWTPSTDARVKTVQVLRGTTPENLIRIAALPSAARSYTDTTVQGGVDYVYVLVATDQSGQVSGRGSLTAATGQNLTPPVAPNGLKVASGEQQLTLNWAANPENDLRGYLVYRSEGQQASSRELLLTGLPIQTLSYTDPIPAGVQTRYHYRLVAVNTSQVQSPSSAAVTAALLDTAAPPAPVLAAVSPSGTGLTLNWSQADVPDLDGFEIARSADAAPAVVLKTLNGKARTYTDTDAVPGVTYTYTLRSLDKAGNRSKASASQTAARPATAGAARPTGLRAALLPDKGGVHLTWVAGSTPARYVVYRLDGERPVQVSDTLTVLTFTDPQGQADSRYELRALSGGDLSAPTPAVPVTP